MKKILILLILLQQSFTASAQNNPWPPIDIDPVDLCEYIPCMEGCLSASGPFCKEKSALADELSVQNEIVFASKDKLQSFQMVDISSETSFRYNILYFSKSLNESVSIDIEFDKKNEDNLNQFDEKTADFPAASNMFTNNLNLKINTTRGQVQFNKNYISVITDSDFSQIAYKDLNINKKNNPKFSNALQELEVNELLFELNDFIANDESFKESLYLKGAGCTSAKLGLALASAELVLAVGTLNPVLIAIATMGVAAASAQVSTACYYEEIF